MPDKLRNAWWVVLLFWGILIANTAAGQALMQAPADSLIATYLNHPEQHAAQKVRALTDMAVRLENTPAEQEQAIGLYQIALSIAPYATDSPAVAARMYAQLSGRLQQAHALRLAIKYCKEALVLQRKADGKKASAAAYNMLGNIAGYYLTDGHYDSAMHYLVLSNEEAKAYGESLWIASSYNNIGYLLTDSGSLVAAGNYLDSALRYAVNTARTEDRNLICAIMDNRAELALKHGRMADAAVIYHTNIALADSLLEGESRSKRIWKSYLGLVRSSSIGAEATLAKARVLMKENPAWFNADDSLRQFEIEESYYLAQKRWQAAGEVSIAKDALRLRLEKEQNAQLNNVFEALTFSNIYNFKTTIGQYRADVLTEKRWGKLYLLIGILSAIIMIIVSIATRARYKARHQLQEVRLRAQAAEQDLAQATIQNQLLLQEKAEQELIYKKKDLADLGTYVGRLKSLYEGMVEKLDTLRSQTPQEQQQGLQRLANEVNIQLQSQERIVAIQQNVEEINAEFNSLLLQLFPELSRSELELCGFIRLGMSNKEVAVIKNISQESAKMARYRLRKKLQLKPDDDIYVAIAGFVKKPD